MKKLLLLFLPMFFSCLLFAQTEPAAYQIKAEKFKEFYEKNQPDSLYQLFGKTIKASMPADKAGLLLAQLKSKFGKLNHLQFDSFNSPVAFYNADFEKGNYIMSLSLDDEKKLNGFFFKPQTSASKPVAAGLKESPFNVTATEASLSGSLIVPENANGKIPVVLIIAGSGPTDRNGNNGNVLTANSYFMLAEALGKAGIASVRYDKRAVGKSTTTKNLANVSFDDFINDANALLRKLKADPRFSKVIVLGHSEGSLIGMIAAEKEKADAYISLAGPGDRVDKLMAVQLKNQPAEEYKRSLKRLDSLSKGLTVKADMADPIFSPIIQTLMISLLKYNPQTEIKKLKIPVLVIQGTTDLQVSVADAQKLKKAKPDAKLVIIDGMNHTLKDAPADREKNTATYKNPDLPLDAKLVDAVTQFVKQLK